MARNRKTKGRVQIGGVGRAGLKVKVFDQEYLFGVPVPLVTDYLGSDTTDADGDYSVTYSRSKYGAWPDEDRVKISEGSLWPWRLPKYGPGKPDLFVEVWHGDVRLETSSPIRRNVGSSTKTINVNLDADPEAERSPVEAFVDTALDILVGVAEAVADGAEALFGAGAGDAVRTALVEPIVALRDTWETSTNRAVSMPDDLWKACRKRYCNYKRDVLLRHFLPPDRSQQRFRYERAIPYLVSVQNLMGRIPADGKVPQCHPTATAPYKGRLVDPDGEVVSHGELKPLTSLARPNGSDEAWSNEQWAAYMRSEADVRARDYENGLAGTGSLIACLAFEYALCGADDSDSNSSREGYRQECEDLIMLALDAIEDLEQRTSLPGYIIRYHEDGDAVEYHPDGDEVCRFDAGDSISVLAAGNIPSALVDAIDECGEDEGIPADASVLRSPDSDSTFIIVSSDAGYCIALDGTELVVCRVRAHSCGLPEDGSYCRPVGPPPSTEELSDDEITEMQEEHARQRLYEPSGDEYMHLMEGLSAAHTLLPRSSPVQARIEVLIDRVRSYMERGYYYMTRPCGNFTLRGPYTSVYAYPLSRFFETVTGAAPHNTGVVPKETVLSSAGLASEDEIHIKADEMSTMWAVLNAFGLLSPEYRLRAWAAYAIVPQLDVTDAIEWIDGLVKNWNEELQEDWQDLRKTLLQKEETENDPEGTRLYVQTSMAIWTLWIFSKSCLLGRGADEPVREWLRSTFRNWFDFVGDKQFRAARDKLGYSRHPVTLATAVALPGRRTHAVWSKLRTFFDEHPECRSQDNEREGGAEGWSVSFPMDHLRMEFNHKGTANPRAIGKEKAGEAMVMQAMWPIAIIGHALSRPLDASIADFVEEPDMPSRDQIRQRVEAAMAARSALLNKVTKPRYHLKQMPGLPD